MPLERILEPEVMDSEEDAVEYDAMDFTDVNLAFALRAIELAPSSGTVVDIGTGTARIPILMLQHSPKEKNIVIKALDLSAEMLKVAARNVSAAGLGERLHLQRSDAKRLPFADASFEMVISNSLVHHLPEPDLFFSEVARLVRSGGGILIRDLIRPDTNVYLEELVEKHVADASEYQRQLFRDSLHASLTIQEVELCLRKVGITDVSIVQPSDRHWSVERSSIRM